MALWGNYIISPTSSLTYWDTQSKEIGTTVYDAAAATLGCNRAMLVFSRTTPAATREDVATINMHIGKDAGALVSYFTLAADLNAALTPITTWWTSQKAMTSSGFTFKEVRWYQQVAGQLHTGPPIRVDAVGVAGAAAASRAPDQLCATVTLKTAARKHWGRVYLPGLDRGAYDTTYGRFATGTVDLYAQYFRTMANSLNSAGFRLGVWSRVANSWLDLAQLQVDDVPDIQRRRRVKQRSYAKVYTS